MTVEISSISSNLSLGEEGIWFGPEAQSLSYPVDGNEDCFSVEETSFWFRHRNACIEAAVKAFPPEAGGTIFDIGGGNGFVSIGLSAAGFNVALVEPGRVGASNARKRGLATVICATTDTAKFKQHSLPCVGLFDVIEHIEGDTAFLESIRTLLQRGGRLYATVPSYSFLWSAEDVSAGHFRRYSLGRLCKLLRSAGFELEFSSYIFRVLPLPIFLMRSLPYRLGRSGPVAASSSIAQDHAERRGLSGRILKVLLRQEVDCIAQGASMRFGGSCLVVARSA